jgi:phosphohistidine phosphatase
MQNKTLSIVRHAKSSWKYDNVLDIDRPLKNRGIRNAYEMADDYKHGAKPDLIITSPANRAIHTAIIFARIINYPLGNIIINESIYAGYLEVLLNLIGKSDNTVNTLMLVGHNPTFNELANYFLKKPIDNIPTAGIVTLTFETGDWKKISKDNLKKNSFIYPDKQN